MLSVGGLRRGALRLCLWCRHDRSGCSQTDSGLAGREQAPATASPMGRGICPVTDRPGRAPDPLRAKRSAIGSTYSPGSSEAPHTSSSPAGTRRLLCTTELCGSIVHIEPPSLNRRIRPHGGTKHQGSPTMRRKSGTSIQQFLAMRYRWWSRHSLHTQPCAYARRFAHPILSKGGLAVFLVAWSSTHS